MAWIADAPYDDDDDVDVNIAAILQLIGERRGPKGRQAEHHNYTNRTTCMHRNRNPCNSVFMVNLASEMDRGRVRTTTTTSHNMAAIQLIPSHAVLVYGICLWYWTSMLWSIDTCQSKLSADLCQVTISWPQVKSSSRSCFFKLTADQILAFDRIAGSCRVYWLYLGRRSGPGCSEPC